MKRFGKTCKLFFAASLSVLSVSASTFGAECPSIPPNHISAPPSGELNIDNIKDLLLDYHQKYYDIDVAAVFRATRNYVKQYPLDAKRPAVVLDIDETVLTNWPNLLADNFGFIQAGSCDQLPQGPCGFDQWIMKSSAKAIFPALELFQEAKGRGVATIFITGRRDKQRAATMLNLDQVGFDGWAELRTRPDRDDLPTVQAFKTAERIKIEAEGYTIMANVGDQLSDLNGDSSGDHSGCRFKVPNPFYSIK